MILRSRLQQSGFSLVELMVAMTLSLILMAGALSILYNSKLTYNDNDRLARLQEAGRAAVELILRDARAAGFPGCVRKARFSSMRVTNNTTLLWNLSQPVFGYEATGGAWAPALDTTNIPSATAGSDVLVLRGSRQGWPILRTTAPLASMVAPIAVQTAANAVVPANTPMVISDCEGTTVFVATSVTGAGTARVVNHVTGTTPGNVDTSVGRMFAIGSEVIPVQTIIYYVRDTGTGPALYQKIGAANPQPMIEGVERMQLLFGIDTNADSVVDQYVKANLVPSWNDVISINIALLIRSNAQTNTDTDTRQYTLLDEPTLGPFNDRRQRSLFITTVALRNRAL
jgi:type IV pilus assembly protein PilW